MQPEIINAMQIKNLQCEYTANPVGLDVPEPQLSWQIQSEKRGFIQSAFQLIVSEAPESPVQNKSLIWDTGKVISGKSAGIRYSGPLLESRKRYYWRLKIWNSDDEASPWSEPAFFEMGLLNKEDWKAGWIGYPAAWTGRVLYFRRDFVVSKPVRRARVYVSGLGYYELYINGKKVGDHILDPSTSDYGKRIYYVTYDITGSLEKENVFGVMIGPGWYGIPKLRLQAEITYTDNTTEWITTSQNLLEQNWKVLTGPIISSSLYDGETYDAREEDPGWNLPSGQTMDWPVAVITDAPGGKMVAQKTEPIKVTDSILPESINMPLKGVYVADAGKNLAGFASIKIKGKRGTIITLKFAELLNDDGTVNQENLRLAKAKDAYILKGGEAEHWEPAFTYHGFRYIQIEGYPYKPQPGDIRINIIRSAVEPTGAFRCSNELLNRIHRMVWQTEASNIHSIPTDCPQRDERMGWLNDMTVRIEQALYNFNLSRFYSKWIDDIKDTQAPDGTITDTAPYRWGQRPADPVSASFLLLAMKCYEFYGDVKIISEHYDGMKAWVDYLNSRTENGIMNYSYWGDWSPPEEFGTPGSIGSGAVSRLTPGIFISTGYLYYCAGILSRMAGILGKKNDEIFYKKLAKKTADAFNARYWNEKTGGYGSNNQACNSFALFLGLVEEKNISRVVDNLVQDVINHNYHLTTGNLCTKYLLEMLTENGHADVAYRITIQETYPGWGFMLANGATTLWERWEYKTGGAMNSHNHPMMSSVGSWFYKYLVGIIPDISGKGFEKFTIHPYIIDDLEFVEGEYKSVKGIIKSTWKKHESTLYLDIIISENSTAAVFIPARSIKNITENDKPVDEVEEVLFLYYEDGYAVFQVGSGEYHFKSGNYK